MEHKQNPINHLELPSQSPCLMPSEVITFNWHSASPRLRYIMASLAALASLWTAISAHSGWMWLFSAVFALGAVGVLADQRTHIDMQARTVSREGHLLGRLRLWHSLKPLDDFCAVGFQRMRAGARSPHDIVYVGLQKQSRKLMALRYFSVKRGLPSAEANAFARSLADTVHLELREEVI